MAPTIRVRFFFPVFIAFASLAAACGGRGGTTPAVAPIAGSAVLAIGTSPQAATLAAGAYNLALTFPQVVTGVSASLTATLQTTLPSGVLAPQVKETLVYLVVSPSATVGFSSAPAFQYTLPSGTSLSAASPAYVLFWNPYVAGSTGWVTLLGPGTVSGQTVTFGSPQTGVTLNANTQYVYALALANQPLPTATPAPTPTPVSSSQPPAYCANYAAATANANSAPQPVRFIDNSGTGAKVVFYVVSGTNPSTPGSTQTQYLTAGGTMTNFTGGATAAPIPLECFPGSMGQSGLTFKLPPPTNPNQSENLYIAYATPGPGGSVPNPLRFAGASNGGNTQPTLDWNASDYAAVPFDYVEFTLPRGVTDVTQVDKVGLPLQLEQGTASIGLAAGQYDNMLSAFLSDATYKNLAVSAQLGGRDVLARILSPSNGENWGFPQDWWYNAAFSGAHSSAGKGYVGYVLAQYNANPQLYTLNGLNGQSGNYCAGSDGSSNVLFYSVGGATSCSALGSPAYTMNVLQTLEGTTTGTDSYGVCHSAIFSMPYGGPGSALTDLTEFYLWKAMVIDIARGVALQNGPHPVGGWGTNPSPPVPLSRLYLDPIYNTYAYLVHKYMINNDSYALQYDEPGGLAPTFTSDPSLTLKITVWNIPAYSRSTPSSLATPLPCPT